MLSYSTYLFLDAARMGSAMSEAKARNKAHDSLYRGRPEESLNGVAPFIFSFSYASPFAGWYLKRGWGKSWGLLVKSSWPLSELHKHFSKMLISKTEAGSEMYFRFYDPRVLRVFLPTCDAGQIREFFGRAIDYFIVEDEDPDYALRFFHQNGILQTERIPVKEQIAQLPEPEEGSHKDERLPPESQAILDKILAEQGGAVEMPAPAPAAVAATTTKAIPPATTKAGTPVDDILPASNKAKTKWNMFD